MLEFIVLGQIPGTRWQLNFPAVLLLWLTAALLARVVVSYYRFQRFAAWVEQSAVYFAVIQNKQVSRQKQA